MALLARLWGTDDFELTDYSSNNPSPGAEDQQFHRDSTQVTTPLAPPRSLHTCSIYILLKMI
jgi:hypothetical protein